MSYVGNSPDTVPPAPQIKEPTFRAAASAFSWDGALVRLPMGADVVDRGGVYDVANSRFKPNIPGFYIVTGRVQTTNINAPPILSLGKNGALVAYGAHPASVSSVVCDIVYMNGTTDYLELWCQTTTSVGATLDNTSGGFTSYWSGALVRAD